MVSHSYRNKSKIDDFVYIFAHCISEFAIENVNFYITINGGRIGSVNGTYLLVKIYQKYILPYQPIDFNMVRE